MIKSLLVVVVDEMAAGAPLLDALRGAGLQGLDDRIASAVIARSGADFGDGAGATIVRPGDLPAFNKRLYGVQPRYLHLRAGDQFDLAAGLYLEAGAPAAADLHLPAARHALALASAWHDPTAAVLGGGAPGALEIAYGDIARDPALTLELALRFAGVEAPAPEVGPALAAIDAIGALAARLRHLAGPGSADPAPVSEPSERIALVLRTRNDEDMVFRNLAWHFASGLRRFVVLDEQSTDCTRSEIDRFARACRPLGADILVLDGQDPADASGRETTRAAHAAREAFGADWIIALGADELLNLRKQTPQALVAEAEALVARRLGVDRTSPLFMAGLRLEVLDHFCSPMDRPGVSDPVARMTFRWRKPRPGFKVGSVQAARWSSDLAFGPRRQAQTAAGAPVPAAEVPGLHLRRYQVRSFDHFVLLVQDPAAVPDTTPDPQLTIAEWDAWREAFGRDGEAALEAPFRERFELDPKDMIHDPLPGVVVRRSGVSIDRSPEERWPVLHLPYKGRQQAEIGGGLYEAEAISLRAPQAPRPVTLRLGTSDIPTFLQVFVREEYAIPLPEAPAYIMDLGANIGLAAAYFAGRFPGARIACVEPDAGNYEMLLANTSGYAGVTALHAAVWPESGRLEVVRHKDDGAPLGAWGVRTRALAGPAAGPEVDHVPALTILEIMQKAGFPRIDLLKVDIEGAELELFSRNVQAWLPFVRYLVVETHDRFKPGSTAAVDAALGGFDRFKSGENLVFIRRGAAPGTADPVMPSAAAAQH